MRVLLVANPGCWSLVLIHLQYFRHSLLLGLVLMTVSAGKSPGDCGRLFVRVSQSIDFVFGRKSTPLCVSDALSHPL